MNKSILTCYGGTGSATGANFLLETGGKKILIDCGLFQGVIERDNLEKFDYDPAAIDYLFVTHAHEDHIGRIPKLVQAGFQGEIYSTQETRDIAELMLPDAAKISQLFGPAEIEKTFSLWKALAYHEVKDFGGFKAKVFNAGHILGSAMYEIRTKEGSMLFTGDLGNPYSVLLPHNDQGIETNYLLMDSVYGDRKHFDKKERDTMFEKAVKETRERGGTLLIPAFSLERTQAVLYELNELFNSKKVEQYPVFLDSPLAIRVTEVYERVSKFYKQTLQNELKHDDIFKFPTLRETAEVKDSREIAEVKGPKIIIAGSGMSTAGRITIHEERYLPDPKTTILFVGYQVPGTLGRQIEEGAKEVSIEGRKVSVKADVISIGNFSGHADSDELTEFVSTLKGLKKVFVAMGEPRSSIFLAQRIRNELNINATVPERGKQYELEM